MIRSPAALVRADAPPTALSGAGAYAAISFGIAAAIACVTHVGLRVALSLAFGGPIELILAPMFVAVEVAAKCLELAAAVTLWALIGSSILLLCFRPLAQHKMFLRVLLLGSMAAVLLPVPWIGPWIALLAWVGIAGWLVWKSNREWSIRAAILAPGVAMLLVTARVHVRSSDFSLPLRAALASSRVAEVDAAELVLRRFRSYSEYNGGSMPRHVLELVAGPVFLPAGALVGNGRQPSSVLVDGTDLVAFARMNRSQQRQIIDAMERDLSSSATHYRVGDYVFVHRGIRRWSEVDGTGIWLALYWPLASGDEPVLILSGDGRVDRVGRSAMDGKIAAQNEMRSEVGLDPLPNASSLVGAD